MTLRKEYLVNQAAGEGECVSYSLAGEDLLGKAH